MVISIYPAGFPDTPEGALVKVKTPDAVVAVAVFKACCGVLLAGPKVIAPVEANDRPVTSAL
jgi:hypothetical protein